MAVDDGRCLEHAHGAREVRVGGARRRGLGAERRGEGQGQGGGAEGCAHGSREAEEDTVNRSIYCTRAPRSRVGEAKPGVYILLAGAQ